VDPVPDPLLLRKAHLLKELKPPLKDVLSIFQRNIVDFSPVTFYYLCLPKNGVKLNKSVP
jgi:hypothetical protein